MPDATVTCWVRCGQAQRARDRLEIADGRVFALGDAVRVLGRRDGDADPYGMIGRAGAVEEFVRQGASVARSGVRLGAAWYDVEWGFILQPAESAESAASLADAV